MARIFSTASFSLLDLAVFSASSMIAATSVAAWEARWSISLGVSCCPSRLSFSSSSLAPSRSSRTLASPGSVMERITCRTVTFSSGWCQRVEDRTSRSWLSTESRPSSAAEALSTPIESNHLRFELLTPASCIFSLRSIMRSLMLAGTFTCSWLFHRSSSSHFGTLGGGFPFRSSTFRKFSGISMSFTSSLIRSLS